MSCEPTDPFKATTPETLYAYDKGFIAGYRQATKDTEAKLLKMLAKADQVPGGAL
jgi:hypothetical protein